MHRLTDHYRYSDHRTIRRGDLCRVSGGPLYEGRPANRWRGAYRFLGAFQEHGRTLVRVEAIDRTAIDPRTRRPVITSTWDLYVDGDAPLSSVPGFVWQPYRLARITDNTARKRGLALADV